MSVGEYLDGEVREDPGKAFRHSGVVVGMAPTPERKQHRPVESPQGREIEVRSIESSQDGIGARPVAWPSTVAAGPGVAGSGRRPAQVAAPGTPRASRARPCRAAAGTAPCGSAQRRSSPTSQQMPAPSARDSEVAPLGSPRTRATTLRRLSSRQGGNGRSPRRRRRAQCPRPRSRASSPAAARLRRRPRVLGPSVDVTPQCGRARILPRQPSIRT
jgi:hypothetical protein